MPPASRARATAYSATTVLPDPVGAATSTDAAAGVEGVEGVALEVVEREAELGLEPGALAQLLGGVLGVLEAGVAGAVVATVGGAVSVGADGVVLLRAGRRPRPAPR